MIKFLDDYCRKLASCYFELCSPPSLPPLPFPFPFPPQTHRILDEEEREDSALRDRFKEKWGRQPSAKLTENMRKEVRGQSNDVIIAVQRSRLLKG